MKKVLILSLTLLSSFAMAKVKITSVNFANASNNGEVTIRYEGNMKDIPELVVKNKIIQLEIPNSFVWPKIDKKVSLNSKFDSSVMAYQFNKDLVRVRAILPYETNSIKHRINVSLKDGFIKMNFPVIGKKNTKVSRSPSIKAKDQKKSADAYDESYLEKLLSDKEVNKMQKIVAKEDIPKVIAKDKRVIDKDIVKTSQSATEKKSFSMIGYVGKIVAFLGIILLFFYGIVLMFRKGVLKKGKLGFLNSTKVIEVLNTTFVGPKKSMMLIRAHRQIFLVGVDDKGMHLISEIKDMNGLLKDGERDISGSNFDTSLLDAGNKDKEFKLKDMEQPSSDTPKSLSDLIDGETQKKNVKLSDQIKSKVKGMKSLQ